LNLATLSSDRKTLKAFLAIKQTVPSFNSTLILSGIAITPAKMTLL